MPNLAKTMVQFNNTCGSPSTKGLAEDPHFSIPRVRSLTTHGVVRNTFVTQGLHMLMRPLLHIITGLGATY